MRWVRAFVVAAAMAVSVGAAQAHDLGPGVGAPMPAISAPDQSGAQRTLASLAGANGTVLLVTRSADWCPFCQRQLIGLEGVRAQIEARGWKLAAITTDTVEELARFQQRRNIGFPMLSDEQAQIVRTFDLLDPTQPPARRHNGLPVPTIFFVSAEGVVLAKLGDENYRVRPEPETVIATIDELAR